MKEERDIKSLTDYLFLECEQFFREVNQRTAVVLLSNEVESFRALRTNYNPGHKSECQLTTDNTGELLLQLDAVL